MQYRAHRHDRLHRSRRDRVFAGVCGGIAEHFGFNSTGVRLAFFAITFFTVGFGGLIIYVALALMLREAPPEAIRATTEDEDFYRLYRESRAAALRKVQRRFETLDKRLQRLESIVTSPTWEVERELNRL